MHRRTMRTVVTVAFLSILCTATASMAQPIGGDCGSVIKGTDAYQFADLKMVEGVTFTQRTINACPITVRAEGWIQGYGGAMTNQGGPYYIETVVIASVPHYSTYTARGKHFIIFYPNTWHNFGTSQDQVTLVAPNPPRPPQQECEVNGGIWDPYTETCDDGFSPIVVDVDGGGYRLTSAANGVLFDLNADGRTEQVAWTKVRPDGDVDAWLAIDRNGNGVIDDGSEL